MSIMTPKKRPSVLLGLGSGGRGQIDLCYPASNCFVCTAYQPPIDGRVNTTDAPALVSPDHVAKTQVEVRCRCQRCVGHHWTYLRDSPDRELPWVVGPLVRLAGAVSNRQTNALETLLNRSHKTRANLATDGCPFRVRDEGCHDVADSGG